MSLLGLDKEIQSARYQAVETFLVVLLVCLGHSGVRPGDFLLFAGILGSGIGGRLCILHKSLDLICRLGFCSTEHKLIVPRIAVVRVVLSNITSGSPAFLDLLLPILVGWCSTLEVEIFCERER